MAALDSSDLVEVPDVAYAAVLALLRDLVDVENEHEHCPLCDYTTATGEHDDECPIGRARTVREALDYSDPHAQARAVELLGGPEAPLTAQARRAEEDLDSVGAAIERSVSRDGRPT